MSEPVPGTGSEGPLPVAPASAPAFWLEIELNASVAAAGGAATVTGGAGVSGAAAAGMLDTELNAAAGAGAVAAVTAGCTGTLEMDVKPWAAAPAAVPS